MKFKIFEGKNEVPVEIAHPVRLVKTADGVSIAFVNDAGNVIFGGYICTLTKEGYLRLCDGVVATAGLQLDGGHIATDSRY